MNNYFSPNFAFKDFHCIILIKYGDHYFYREGEEAESSHEESSLEDSVGEERETHQDNHIVQHAPPKALPFKLRDSRYFFYKLHQYYDIFICKLYTYYYFILRISFPG